MSELARTEVYHADVERRSYLPFILLATLFITLSATGIILFDAGMAGVSIFLGSFILALPILFALKIWYKISFPWAATIPLIAAIALTTIMQFSATKFTSVGYSAMFILLFMMALMLLRMVPLREVARVMQWVIYLYAANVAMAMLASLLGMDALFSSVLRTEYDPRVDSVRYAGFASEPSYAAFIVVSALLCNLRLVPFHAAGSRVQEIRLIVLVAILILLFQSVYGYLLFGIVLGWYLLSRFKITGGIAIAGAILLLVAADVFGSADGTGRISRLIGIINADDLSGLREADSSVGVRLIPMLDYVLTLATPDLGTWFGHGAGAAQGYFTNAYLEHLNPDSRTGIFNLGFLPAFLYDFGLIGAALVLWGVGRLAIPRFVAPETAIILLLLFNANFNTQLFWFVSLAFVACTHARNAFVTESGSIAAVLRQLKGVRERSRYH